MREAAYDAVIAGAGPAGSATARRIAERGFRVLLLEEHAAVGLPSHCSGLITPRTLDLAGVGAGVVVNEIRGAVVHAPGGGELSLGGKRLQAVAVERAELDAALVERAQQAGAVLSLETRLTALERGCGGVYLRLQRRRREFHVSTRLLIGADGAQSRVAAAMAVRTLQRDTLVGLGAEARLTAGAADFVHIFLGEQVAPGFFAWVIPLGGGRARLGLATNGPQRPVHHLRALLRRLPERFKGLEVTRWYGGLIPLRRLSRIYDDRMMLVGDAAGHVKPTSGGGIYTALLGAEGAAEVAVRALAADSLGVSSLAAYQDAWDAQMGAELARGWDLRRALLGLEDRELSRLLRILGSPPLSRLLTRHGDIDFPSRAALRLLSQLPWLRARAKIPLAGLWQDGASGIGRLPASATFRRHSG